MINSIEEFINRVNQLENVSDAYGIFEDECTPEVRDSIYSLASPDSAELFRESMNELGFSEYLTG